MLNLVTIVAIVVANGISKKVQLLEELPEDNEYFLEPREDEFEAETTIKVLVMTDQGDITDNRRLKMAVGKKEWVWFMGYDDDAQVVKWRPLNVL